MTILRTLDAIVAVVADAAAGRQRTIVGIVGAPAGAASAWATGPDAANTRLIEVTVGRADHTIELPRRIRSTLAPVPLRARQAETTR